ncbi:hypothetical protein [Amycolatopsis thailandensis]|nr:hypothetical protein [Amycolatopsis thailandensis]
MPIWENPDCDTWCPGKHGIPGEDHSHSLTIDWHIVVAATDDWLQVGLHREEGASDPQVFLTVNDLDEGRQDMTIAEAERLIRALRKAVKTAKKGRRK